jgi:dihydrofolate reductase
MGKLVVINHVTLDGVMQAPGRPDEDTRDGFSHGGWAQAGNDPLTFEAMGRYLGPQTPLLLGRRTYEDFAAYWPTQGENPFTRALEQMPKYVASRTLAEPLPWRNSYLLSEPVADLKRRLDGDLVIMGSGELIRSLLADRMIDEYLLMIHPLVLGEGRRLFGAGTSARLRLLDSRVAGTGVVISTYRPA